MSAASKQPDRGAVKPVLNTLAAMPAPRLASDGSFEHFRPHVTSSVAQSARVVVVDDDPAVLEVLKLHLEDAGFQHLVMVEDATQAMSILRTVRPDLLLTDLRMPVVDGFDLLAEVREDPVLGYLPVVMLTSDSDPSTRIKALDLGVTDFLSKPIDPSELVLRLRNNLVVKAYQDEITAARRESDRLLLSILPEPVASRLKRGETVADHFDSSTVLFADLVDFTRFASGSEVAGVLRQLNGVFGLFDQVVEARGLEKIKTIGDAYMLAGGVPSPHPDHVYAVVEAGLAMLKACEQLRFQLQTDLQVRIGIHTGPVLGGVIGSSKFAYDLWGDTVNVASRMESHGIPGRIQVSEAVREAVGHRFQMEPRGLIDIKGKGAMKTWFVRGIRK